MDTDPHHGDRAPLVADQQATSKNNVNIMLNLDVLLSDFAVKVGAGCLIGQLGLVFLFRNISSHKKSQQQQQGAGGGGEANVNVPARPPWSQMPSFTAHQIMCLPVMGFLIVEGIRYWDWSFPGSAALVGTTAAATATSSIAFDRIVASRHIHFSQFVFGMMVCWDLPSCLLTPALRDAAMAAHHFGMLLVAGIALGALSNGRPLLGYYAPFFFGVIEVSSLPLIFVDLFHPRHTPWHDYLTKVAPKWIAKVNDACRIVFAMTFLSLRAIYFPYVTVVGVIPDLLAVRRLSPADRPGIPNLPLDIMVVFNTLFSCLQMYWGYLVIRQVVKLLQTSSSSSSSHPAKKGANNKKQS
jgi:TLC domain